MSWIVLELGHGPENAAICTDLDGNNMVFDTKEEAEDQAMELQDGRVVEV